MDKDKGLMERAGRTNADHIRAMSDEELGEWLYEYFWGRRTGQPIKRSKLIGWLQQPALEEGEQNV